MMDTWTRQAGYPLVTVQVHADRRNVSISQSRFFLKNRGTNHTNKWDIPLNWATSWDNANFNRTDRQFILSKSDKSLEVELISKTDWIIFNVQQTGILTRGQSLCQSRANQTINHVYFRSILACE